MDKIPMTIGGHKALAAEFEHRTATERRRIVQRVAFDSPDPAFAGSMTMTWSLDPVPGGTDVTIRCEDVPPGIDAQDHAKGLSSSLDNLAAYVSKAGPALPG